MDANTIRVRDAHAVCGPLNRVMAIYRETGRVFWLRGNGSGRLFYRDSETGRMRQKSWRRVVIVREAA